MGSRPTRLGEARSNELSGNSQPASPAKRGEQPDIRMAHANFFEKVYATVKTVPKGKVATYQQIATLITTPRAAQAVGWALRALPEHNDVPWQRVINSKGMISIENMRAPKPYQAQLLKKEGVKVTFVEGNYFVDLKKYLWNPKER